MGGPANIASTGSPALDRPHDPFAEIGFGDQQRAQFVGPDQKRLDIALGMAVRQCDAPRELAAIEQPPKLAPARRIVVLSAVLANLPVRAGVRTSRRRIRRLGARSFLHLPALEIFAQFELQAVLP